MVKKIMLSLLIFIAATSVAHAEESFNDRKANLTEIHALRVGYGSGTVRIVLDVTKPLEFKESYVENPSRMILDLKNAWLNSDIQREIVLKSLAAKKVRIAQFNPTTVRIVIETAAATKPFNLNGGATGHRFVIDVGNAEFKENPELNKPEPIKTEPPKPVEPTKPRITEVPKEVELVDADDLKKQRERELKEKQEREIKEQREREKQEKELREKQEKELKEKQERELKEKREREIKEQREREKKEKELKEKQERELKKQRERELKEQKEREKREKKNKDKKDKTDSNKDKEVKTPFGNLDTDLEDITTLSGRTIVIDPGHGGNDAGAIGPTGVMEKSVTLNVALELRKLLEAEGATVIMTRETDTTVSYKGAKASDIEELGARCEVANSIGADIFISIHADSFTRPEARGTTGYYYSGGSGRGQKLADCIRRNLVEQLGTPSRGTQPCNFYVVRHTDMPATLIELGFISNKDEERLLDSKEGVQRAAQGILDGIEDYFG